MEPVSPPPTVKKQYAKSKSLDRRVQGILSEELHNKLQDAVEKTKLSESAIVCYALNLVNFDKLILRYEKLNSK